MIKINNKSKVYIACPAAYATGGPELLHQLAFNLRKQLHVNALMYYFPDNYIDPVHDAYKKYNNPYVKRIDDNMNNILIVPEVKSGLALLNNYNSIRKAIWWLSVDNFYRSDTKNTKLFLYKVINKLLFLITKTNFVDVSYAAQLCARADMRKHGLIKIFFIKQVDYHLVQSFYAKKYLLESGIDPKKIFYLSDYLNKNFLKIKTDPFKKQNIVAYNPKKGYCFTKKIIETAPDIKFMPLENMNREQIINALKAAKVYIDFGNHPGKDRMPREAAILFCYIITGKRGSAEFFEDIPLSERYKFDNKNCNIPKIVDKIHECFINPINSNKEFISYRRIIASEPKIFLKDLRNVFKK